MFARRQPTIHIYMANLQYVSTWLPTHANVQYISTWLPTHANLQYISTWLPTHAYMHVCPSPTYNTYLHGCLHMPTYMQACCLHECLPATNLQYISTLVPTDVCMPARQICSDCAYNTHIQAKAGCLLRIRAARTQ